jgi:hypothetical protein
MVNYKTKGDRVKDAILILTRLQAVGVSKTDPGYLETKRYLDEWINTGEYAHHKYYFFRFARRAELILINRKEVEPTFHLFAPDKD